tara:strand:+ start:2088 stop:2306 length:219 start_codon:yes stop_codon:yes gene_type:complete
MVQVLDYFLILFFNSLLTDDMILVVGLISLVAIELVLDMINLNFKILVTFSNTGWLILDLDVVSHGFVVFFS